MENALKNVDSIVKDRKLSVGAKALFFYILNIGNTEYPDRNTIAFDLNISNCTLGKYLKELTKSGYITCVQNKENGKFSKNNYTLNIGKWFYAKAEI